MTPQSTDDLVKRIDEAVARFPIRNEGVYWLHADEWNVLKDTIERLQRERDEYKIWWERDSTSLGKMISDRDMQRACKEDFRAQAATFRNKLSEAVHLLKSSRCDLCGGMDVGDCELCDKRYDFLEGAE